MNVLDIPCRRENYGGHRGQDVRYLVVHYTAVPGDTAEHNGRYFARADTDKTSAHYFVDEHQIVRSVPEDYAAYHCGGSSYCHPACRNANSIGVELCTRGGPGNYFFAPGTLENARRLLRSLMDRYHIPAQRVLRHYDVTGKCCPAPFVGAGQRAWERFKEGLTVYNTVEDVPGWARHTVEKLVDWGVLAGDGQGNLDLSGDLVRVLVILDRLGILQKQEEEHG